MFPGNRRHGARLSPRVKVSRSQHSQEHRKQQVYRFGVDVPVILRSSDESESVLPTPEKHMVQVTNPFGLEVGHGPASVSGGVYLRPCCLEPCVLTCFWGCEIRALQGVLHAHQHSKRISTPQHIQEALQLRYLHCESFTISCEEGEELHTQIPADRGVIDLGPMPRECYPLVAVLTLTEQDARETHNIVVSVSVLHVPDDRYSLSARVLFQYLLTSQGNMYELKPLFMSADSGGASSISEQSSTQSEPREASRPEQSPVLEEEQEQQLEDELWSVGGGRDCVVCQNAAVNRVLLPCRHACVCDGCVSRFQHCPICRAFILESFSLCQQGAL
ncbi:cell growth regulator with RING finger domain protein 1 isoform X2 [Labrus mixtus]|uniref:cell growth regulator with RING finger domain protein 1 isoform X2 n=1 Tax=Labrus mixtus TaxID=508554 RepID=UPI0029BFAFA3|nr:cell growth regulator with RING finger domain protein 1 isoform X2 [Labrus mixtus]